MKHKHTTNKTCAACNTFVTPDCMSYKYCKVCTYDLRFLTGRDYARELIRIKKGRMCAKCKKKWKYGERRFDIHHLQGNCGVKTKQYDRVDDIGLKVLCHACHLGLHSVRKKMKEGMRIAREKAEE